MKTSAWWVALGLALVSGCIRHSPETLAEASGLALNDYYPLAVGNAWTYEETLLGVTRTTTIEITGEDNGVFTDSRGAKMRFDAYGLRDDKRYLLKAPIAVGQSWSNVVALGTIERYRVVGVGIDCRHELESAKDCVRVESINRMDEKSMLINELTFAPGIGLLRVEILAEVSGRRVPQTRLELKSFRLRSGT